MLLWRRFLLYFLPVVLLSAGLFLFLLERDRAHYAELIAANERVQLALAGRSITRDLESVIPDVDLLTASPSLVTFAESQSDVSRDLLLNEWQTFLRQKRHYLRLRIIDPDGREMLRVEHDAHGGVRALPENELQDKQQRYYFQEARKLGPGELYISPIDLEVEHGQVIEPHTPLLRFAMPIFSADDMLRGIFVLSYRASRMIEHFDEMLGGSRGHISLLNQDGYWIRAPQQPEREWGFMLDNDWSYARVHPKAWARIGSADHGQFSVDGSLFSFLTLYPLETIGGYKARDDGDYHGHFHIDPHSYRLKLVSDVDASVQHSAYFHRLSLNFLQLWLLVVGGAAVATWLLARSHVERRILNRQLALDALVVEATTDGVFVADAERRILSVNEGFTRITGYRADEVLGYSPKSLTAGSHEAKLQEAIWKSLVDTGRWQGEVSNRRKDGSLYHEWLSLRAVRNRHGEVVNYVGIFSDITAQKHSEAELQRMAHHDALTGLPNRLLFNDRLHQALAHCRRHERRMALLFIDLDRFKPINDQWGHEVGDEVLREVAKRLQQAMREEDTVARIGGDEFVVLIGELEEASHPHCLAERLLELLRQPIVVAGHVCQLGASIGVAIYPEHADSEEQLLRRADEAMYRIKQQGRDGIALYASEAEA